MRVALDMTHATLIRTGLGRYPAELAPALGALGDVDPIELSAAERPAGTVPMRLLQGLRREGLYYPLELARRARRLGARLLHCPVPVPVRGGGLPLVVTVHDLLPLRMPAFFTRQTHAHTRLWMRFVRHADAVLTNSEWTRSEVIELLGVPADRVTATPFGIAERFRPGPAPAELRARHGLEGRYVLSVATREPRKNLLGTIAAFERVAAAVPDVSLALVGGRGWRDAEIERRLAQVGDRVRVLGFVEDDELVALYSSADCFLFPSHGEGFGFPPLEAMACGAPVVTSDRTALPEITGDAALHVDPADHEAIAAAVVDVLGDAELAASLRERGLARRERFTWDACARATADVYRSLA